VAASCAGHARQDRHGLAGFSAPRDKLVIAAVNYYNGLTAGPMPAVFQIGLSEMGIVQPPIRDQNRKYAYGFRIQSRPCHCDKLRYFNVRRDLNPMGDTGLEHNADSPGKHAVATQGGAESGAVLTSGSAPLPSELTEIIAKWSRIPTLVQAAILAIIRVPF